MDIMKDNNKRLLRVKFDSNAFLSDAVNLSTGKQIMFYRKDAVLFEIGFFANGDIADIGNPLSAELILKNADDGAAPYPAENILLKMDSVKITPELTTEQWNGGECHVKFDIASQLTNIPCGVKWLVVRLKYPEAQERTYYAGRIYVLETGDGPGSLDFTTLEQFLNALTVSDTGKPVRLIIKENPKTPDAFTISIKKA